MTDDESALMAAIVAAPDDDAPRLVLADLLAGRGDPHGELIVLMCRIAAGAGDEHESFQKRVDALLAVGWKAYAGELAPYASPHAFARGLVERVRMSVTTFVKSGAQLLRRHPLRAVEITVPASGKLDSAKLARVEQVLLELPATHPLREVVLPGGGSPALRTRFPIS